MLSRTPEQHCSPWRDGQFAIPLSAHLRLWPRQLRHGAGLNPLQIAFRSHSWRGNSWSTKPARSIAVHEQPAAILEEAVRYHWAE